MNNSLKNKVCFLTGGSSGIGEAVVDFLIKEGAKVFAVSRGHDRLRKLKESYPRNELEVFSADVADEKAVAEAFVTCRKTFGPVDILINNAGVGIPTPDLSTAELCLFDQMADTNFKGVFLCSREALRDMKPRKRGVIVTVVSTAGQRTNPGAPLYCASKFAARGFSSGLADQVLKDGIRVMDINPGPVDTAYWGERDVPREKFLKPCEVAEVIRFVLTLPEHVVVREINFDNIHWLSK